MLVDLRVLLNYRAGFPLYCYLGHPDHPRSRLWLYYHELLCLRSEMAGSFSASLCSLYLQAAHC